MTPNDIGKLERLPLREVWKHEAYDFTQWLQENIEELNSALDLNLVNVDREQAAGDFSIDLVTAGMKQSLPLTLRFSSTGCL